MVQEHYSPAESEELEALLADLESSFEGDSKEHVGALLLRSETDPVSISLSPEEMIEEMFSLVRNKSDFEKAREVVLFALKKQGDTLRKRLAQHANKVISETRQASVDALGEAILLGRGESAEALTRQELEDIQYQIAAFEGDDPEYAEVSPVKISEYRAVLIPKTYEGFQEMGVEILEDIERGTRLFVEG